MKRLLCTAALAGFLIATVAGCGDDRGKATLDPNAKSAIGTPKILAGGPVDATPKDKKGTPGEIAK